MTIEWCLILKRVLLGCRLFVRYSSMKKILNFLRKEEERIRHVVACKARPYFLKIQPTNKCDAGCVYCLRDAVIEPGEMSQELFKTIIDAHKDYLYMVALHYSGEPLMHTDLPAMIRYAHKQNIATYVSSNMQYLSQEQAEALVVSGLDILTVAVDGVTDETYLKHRKNGSIAVVLENIKKIVALKKQYRRNALMIIFQFIVTAYNEHEIDIFKKVAKECGVDMIQLKPIGTDDATLLPQKNMYVRNTLKTNTIKKNACWWLWSAGVFLYNGDMIPCCMAENTNVCAHISNDQDIHNSELHQQWRTVYFASQPQKHIPCHTCLIPYGSMFQHTM